MVSSRDPKRIFERLLGRLLEGMVVPFIGAGVSIDKVCELWEWSCQHDWEGGSRRRCELILDILKIPEFTNMEPTEAHYYLAFLAREGLIDEVITTNYNTCIEEAYCETFGLRNALARADSPALVIDTLDEYRAKGGKRFADDQKKQRCLKVYKINGCARRLRASRPDGCHEHCKNILLTERDLQDWGKRGWARDLFRDRLRSRTLLFSGFGSDEPQVLYHYQRARVRERSTPLPVGGDEDGR